MSSRFPMTRGKSCRHQHSFRFAILRREHIIPNRASSALRRHFTRQESLSIAFCKGGVLLAVKVHDQREMINIWQTRTSQATHISVAMYIVIMTGIEAATEPKQRNSPCDSHAAPDFPTWLPTKSTAGFPFLFSSVLIPMYTISFAGSKREYLAALHAT